MHIQLLILILGISHNMLLCRNNFQLTFYVESEVCFSGNGNTTVGKLNIHSTSVQSIVTFIQ